MTEINLNATADEIDTLIRNEHLRSCVVHDTNFGSLVEAYGVITEEYHETVEAFRVSKVKYPVGSFKLRTELIQLAAMCRKTIGVDATNDKDRIEQLELFDIVCARYDQPRYESAMEALGTLTLHYNNLSRYLTSVLVEGGSEVDSRDFFELITQLAISCKFSLMSCCFNQKKVKEGVE